LLGEEQRPQLRGRIHAGNAEVIVVDDGDLVLVEDRQNDSGLDFGRGCSLN
jgi:hypothetical protein